LKTFYCVRSGRNFIGSGQETENVVFGCNRKKKYTALLMKSKFMQGCQSASGKTKVLFL
jgi:hypothetical protein